MPVKQQNYFFKSKVQEKILYHYLKEYCKNLTFIVYDHKLGIKLNPARVKKEYSLC